MSALVGRTPEQMLTLADELNAAARATQAAVVELMGPNPNRDPVVDGIRELARQAEAEAGRLFVVEARGKARQVSA